MKDLKHLIYFEKLLEDANNDLVRQAKAEGKIALGYTCFHMPEVLLNLDNCFSVRLRAPNTGSMEVATYYMCNGSCEYSRALLERAMEGNYKFLDAICGVDLCEAMNRCMENMELLHIENENNDKFFYTNTDVAYSDDEDSVVHTVEQLQRKVLNKLHENYGVDISDDALRKAVERHNEICRLITEIGEYRKLENPPITGYEFHVLTLASYTCPKYLIIDKLRETLEEIKTRVPDEKKKYRIRVVVVGSEIDDPDLIKLMEENGALVVADRFCYGSFPGRQEIILNDEEPVLKQICRQYLQKTECPRHCAPHRVKHRYDFVNQLVHDFHADGVIYEQMKFCTYWSYERTLASYVMNEEYKIPTLSIDRPYRARSSGQLRTRIQAFVENVEIKKIKAKREQNSEVK
ncbi:MAG: 2-hydroxyacyl-CoA dehydratase family protein [Candidatus Enterosoma sp.]|nr:2-hydroxyacyl-CoA dehydratase family protein [Bacilli bacterium]MDD7181164.1 2-hydroxyacyl-CoA dehydratase family protein [Bacilli bacterium]MDY3048102.1 2-hydroxyacyl-CoA dehydratase family protein [Candidatus Enterosoma sp.]